ncbi:hypothetical protein FOWG_01069 [Fusarium oxysporum f. sp. lycopersici MN25]|nr:hypothetical protein FOWG_01069 [Fusarium oxysporum f. sp. lycopersici MN25]
MMSMNVGYVSIMPWTILDFGQAVHRSSRTNPMFNLSTILYIVDTVRTISQGQIVQMTRTIGSFVFLAGYLGAINTSRFVVTHRIAFRFVMSATITWSLSVTVSPSLCTLLADLEWGELSETNPAQIEDWIRSKIITFWDPTVNTKLRTALTRVVWLDPHDQTVSAFPSCLARLTRLSPSCVRCHFRIFMPFPSLLELGAYLPARGPGSLRKRGHGGSKVQTFRPVPLTLSTGSVVLPL